VMYVRVDHWGEGGYVEPVARDGNCLLPSLSTQLEDEGQCSILLSGSSTVACVYNGRGRFLPFIALDIVLNNVRLCINITGGYKIYIRRN
jgi:hypothetical protein